VRYAFEEVGIERVIAGADAPNTASLRVMEKLGMKYVGNINARAPEEPTLRITGRISLRR
jgi:RimJ/RimL family protein N-acetyltransferase